MSENEMDGAETVNAGEVAIEMGLESMMRVHEIERTMLSRSIEVIHRLTNKPVEQIISQLSVGLNEDYDSAVNTTKAASEVAKLYVPKEKRIITPPR